MTMHANSMPKLTILAFLLFAFGPVVLLSQETGKNDLSFPGAGFKKYIRNFTRKECGGLSVNRAIIQDKRGVMYFGGEGGLREYNGVAWRSIQVPNDWVNAMDMAENGVIYLGGLNRFGFLETGENGERRFKALDHLLPPGKNEFTILNVHAAGDGIYFNAGRFLTRVSPGQNRAFVWEPRNGKAEFDFSAEANRVLYIHETGSGLKHLVDRTLRPVRGFVLPPDERICMLVPYGNRQLLAGTRSNNLYIYDGTTLRRFRTRAAEFLRENRLLGGIRLANGDFALATFFGGIVTIDRNGDIKNRYNKRSGLPDALVNFIYEDFQGNLWAALEAGISRIENMSPFSLHLSAPKYCIHLVRHQNQIYLMSNLGLHRMDRYGNLPLVPGVPIGNRVVSMGDTLIVSTQFGVYSVQGKKVARLCRGFSNQFIQSSIHKNRIYVQSKYRVLSLDRTGGQWLERTVAESDHRLLLDIVEDSEGNLWTGTIDNYRLKPGRIVLKIHRPVHSDAGYSRPQVTRFGRAAGLPGDVDGIYKAAGRVIFSTHKGIYSFDPEHNRFVPEISNSEPLTRLLGKKGIEFVRDDSKRNVWAILDDGSVIYGERNPDGSYKIIEKPFLSLPPGVNIEKIFTDPDGRITWFYGRETLIIYRRRPGEAHEHDFHTLVYRVLANGKPITVDSPLISFNHRHLSFDFAAPFFQGENSTRYRYKLEGRDRGWSAWDTKTRASYNDLDSGAYRFLVQSENIYRQPGSAARFAFTILPPWYRTWWAFLSYALAALMLAYLIIKWRRAIQLGRDKTRLENIVRQRVEEIKAKNRQLEEQTVRLKEQSEKLQELDKAKSRFFANISHEFRTPLTLIMAPLEQMIDAGDNGNADSGKPANRKQDVKKLTLMLRNAQRLLRLIDQLLELSRLESGKLTLQAYPQDITRFIKGIAASFEPAATRNELELSITAPGEAVEVYFDPVKMEEVWFNLLSNAVKFTPPGGRIALDINVSRDSGMVSVSVSDTGPGIPREQLIHIFDRFFQADSTFEHHQKGSGIGLALARELVELHKGTIDARDTAGRGATFIVRLPLGSDHLSPKDIIEPDKIPFKHKTPLLLPGTGNVPGNDDENDDELARGEQSGKKTNDREIILVAEDNADFREYIAEILEPYYGVTTVNDGPSGFETAKKIIPDLIISDVMMPGIDGLELCRRLKTHRDTGHIPVILLTARASENNIVKGLDTGADDYVTKPFNSNILLSRIKNLILQRRRLQLERQKRLTDPPEEKTIPSADDVFYKELKEIMEKNLSNPDFTIEQLKKILNMGRTTLYRKILAITGLSPNRFIRSFRLKRAARLLEADYGNVSEVALAVGFSNMAYFSQCFKEEFKCSPSAYSASFPTRNRR